MPTPLGLFYAYEEAKDPRVLYSASHIASLTVEAAMRLRIPPICHPGELKIMHWSSEEPIGEIVTLLHSNNPVPSVEDIRSILADGIIKFGQGFRSVCVRVHSMYPVLSCSCTATNLDFFPWQNESTLSISATFVVGRTSIFSWSVFPTFGPFSTPSRDTAFSPILNTRQCSTLGWTALSKALGRSLSSSLLSTSSWTRTG